MDETQALGTQKIELLKQWLPDLSAIESPHIAEITVGDVGIRIIPKGPRATEVGQFLIDYFRKYPRPKVPPKKVISVHWHEAPQEYRIWSHRIWLSHFPYFVEKIEGDVQYVAERDFIFKAKRNEFRYDVVVPEFIEGAMDSVDNLMMRILTDHAHRWEGFMLHASGVVRNGQAYVFFGQSGAGKSTIALQCRNKEGLAIIGEDKIFLQNLGDTVIAAPVPMRMPTFQDDKQLHYATKPAPLAGLYHLSRESVVGVRPARNAEFLGNLVQEIIGFGLSEQSVKNDQRYFDIATTLLCNENVVTGSLSYKLGRPFWPLIDLAQTSEMKSDEKKI